MTKRKTGPAEGGAVARGAATAAADWLLVLVLCDTDWLLSQAVEVDRSLNAQGRRRIAVCGREFFFIQEFYVFNK